MSGGDWFLVVFSMGAGVSIAGFWALVSLRGRVRQLAGGRKDFGAHVAAELVTAILLIAGGIGIASSARWGEIVTALGVGALAYALVEVPAHYLGTGNRLLGLAALAAWPFAIAAAAILVV